MYDKPLIAKGTKIKFKGDLICTALVDCWPGQPMAIDLFEWFVEKPTINDQIHPALMVYIANRIKQVSTLNSMPVLKD